METVNDSSHDRAGVLLTRPRGSALADPPAVHLAILISYWSNRSDARSRTISLPLASGLILSHGSMTFPSEICRLIYGSIIKYVHNICISLVWIGHVLSADVQNWLDDSDCPSRRDT